MEEDGRELIGVLIADSAAFLKNVELQNIAENVYTISEVLGEIKSTAVRQRLAVLPYEITFRVPSAESLHVVSEFAKKTGDFQSLSLVDLKVLALTYQLHKEKCGTSSLRSEPCKKVEVVDKCLQGNVPGFYTKRENIENNAKINDLSVNVHEMDQCMEQCSLEENDVRDQLTESRICDAKCEPIFGNVIEAAINEDIIDSDNNKTTPNESTNACSEENNGYHRNEDDSSNDKEDWSDDDDDGVGWITPTNVGQVKAEFCLNEMQLKPKDIKVGCLTTDFAMQNVLIKMGLHVISVEGMLIREARSYVLKCYSCFKVTSQMQRIFCPKCGNHTLVKVSVSVDAAGVTRYHVPKRNKPFNIRGKKYPLPLPKGGRHNQNPLLFEDQLITQRRLPKSRDKVNVLDDNYVARSSPFAVNDTTSRAFNLGFHVRGQNRRNPNEARKKTRRKK